MKAFTIEHFCGTDARLEVILKTDRYNKKPVGKRPMMVVFPGGGYYCHNDLEAEPVALEFLREGFSTCILRYSLKPDSSFPALGDLPLFEAASALRYVREHAEEWNIDTNKISIIGFSAGGHLAASLGVHWNDSKRLPNFGETAKPNAMVLCYSVITSSDKSDRGSIERLTGISGLSDEDAKYDTSAFVSSLTPPAFIWHTFEDRIVPVENSMAMAAAMRKAKVPFELHIFTEGPHGMSVATDEVGAAPKGVEKWVGLCVDWLRNRNML